MLFFFFNFFLAKVRYIFFKIFVSFEVAFLSSFSHSLIHYLHSVIRSKWTVKYNYCIIIACYWDFPFSSPIYLQFCSIWFFCCWNFCYVFLFIPLTFRLFFALKIDRSFIFILLMRAQIQCFKLSVLFLYVVAWFGFLNVCVCERQLIWFNRIYWCALI